MLLLLLISDLPTGLLAPKPPLFTAITPLVHFHGWKTVFRSQRQSSHLRSPWALGDHFQSPVKIQKLASQRHSCRDQSHALHKQEIHKLTNCLESCGGCCTARKLCSDLIYKQEIPTATETASQHTPSHMTHQTLDHGNPGNMQSNQTDSSLCHDTLMIRLGVSCTRAIK